MSEKEARERREELFRLLAKAEDSEALTATLIRRMVAQAEEQEPEWGGLLRAAAIPRRLDEGVVGVLRGASDDADGNRAALERLAGYSFVLPDPEGRSCALHEEMRAVLLEDWQAPDRRARYVELSWALCAHFREQDSLEALYHRFVFDSAGAFAEFEWCFRDADVFYRRAECGALLAAAEEQERELDQGQRLWLRHYRARLSLVLDRWAEAEAGYGELLAELPPSPRPAATPLPPGGEGEAQAGSPLPRWGEGTGERGDLKLHTWTLHCLGIALGMQRKWAEAVEVCQEVLKDYREVGDRYNEGKILNNLGPIYRGQGHWDQAIACYQESLRIKRELGDRHGEGQTLNNLGLVYQAQGRWQEASERYEESLRIFRELGDRHGEQETIGNQSRLYFKQGQWQEAKAALDKALQIAQELGNRPDVAEYHHCLGEWHKGQGQLDEALARYEEALAICRELAAWPQVGETLHALAEVYATRGDWAKAAEMAEQAAAAWRRAVERHRSQDITHSVSGGTQ